jgi:hypothetical protein
MLDKDIKTKHAPTLEVECPNGQVIMSNKTTTLAIPNVPETANKARVFETLTSGNLLSIGQMCDSECTALFEKDKVTIKTKIKKQ